MSLFKPSNLTPNFESVVYNQPLTLTFQVNSNGSKVTAYRVQILKDINDDNNSEENIIGTIYGTFDTPLYNKDMGEILLTQEILSYNGINLEPNKDYRWKLRLYGENKRKSHMKTFSVPHTMSIEQRLNAIDFSKDFTIKANSIISSKGVEFYLIISQDDIGGILRNIRRYKDTFNSKEAFWELLKKRCPKSFILSARNIYNTSLDSTTIGITPSGITSEDRIHRYPYSFFKNKIHPYMFFYPIGINEEGNEITIFNPEDLTSGIIFEVEYSQINYQGYYDEDLTYIGNGMLVGSTKQIMWTPSYNEDMKRNSYARLAWCSGGKSNFQPFKFDVETIEISSKSEQSVVVSRSDIKKEYLDNLSNGKYYILLVNTKTPFSLNSYSLENGTLNTEVLTKLRKVVSVQNFFDTDKIQINIPENTDIPKYDNSDYKYLALCYVQQEKIIQIDKGIGNSYLTKITFEEPFDFNPMVSQNIHLGYVSDDFNYDRFYITPIEEFDNSDGFSYIYLCTDGKPWDKGTELSQETIDTYISWPDESRKMYKIINYVSSTGEVTIYNKAKNFPTIQTYYQIIKRISEDKYKVITDMGLLGGKEKSYIPLICNNAKTTMDSSESAKSVIFDELFVQPNVGIKEDHYMPIKLEIYNKYLKQSVYLTNFYNWTEDNGGEKYYNTKLIDNLDDTMWRVVTKNTNNKDSTLIENVTTISENLYFPQTQYKIYSNFVDCVPDGFFYSRYDKSIKFEIYNLNTMENRTDFFNAEGYIDCRDLYIKTICQDSYKDNDGNLVELGTNNVPLKEYHYEIMTEDGTVIYSTKETYDGKFYCKFRGCNNNSIYYIKVYIEDNFGKIYTSQIKVPIIYSELFDRTNIIVTPLCEKQAVKINFAPIKEVDGIGNISLDTNIVSVNDTTGLTYEKYDDNENIIELPQNFSYLTQFKLNPEILNTKRRVLLNRIANDSPKGKIGDTYYLYLDTKPYFYKDNIYSLNPTYMKFIVTVNQELSAEEVISDNGQTIFVRNFANVSLIIPTQFAFIASTSSEINDRYIYIIPDSLLDIEESQRNVFKATVPTTCINGNDLLISNDIYLITNAESYIEKNKTALQSMNTQTFKIIKTDKILEISINGEVL